MFVKIREIERIDVPWEINEMIIHGSETLHQFRGSRTTEIMNAIKEWEGGDLHLEHENVDILISEDIMPKVRDRVLEIEKKHESLDEGFDEFTDGKRPKNPSESFVDDMSEEDMRYHGKFGKVQEARQRSPVVDEAFRLVREQEGVKIIRGSDYVRALEIAIVKLEKEYEDLKQNHEYLRNNTAEEDANFSWL